MLKVEVGETRQVVETTHPVDAVLEDVDGGEGQNEDCGPIRAGGVGGGHVLPEGIKLSN